MGHGIEWKVSLIHSALARRGERRRWSRLRGRGVIGSANVDNVRKWHVSDDEEGGKASRLCPSNSDVDLFGYGESVIDFDAEIPDSALDLRMPQQQLHGT